MATLTVRTDPAVDAAMKELTADGTTASEAVRQAIISAAKGRVAERMRADAERLATDPDDLAEIRRVREEMDELRAW